MKDLSAARPDADSPTDGSLFERVTGHVPALDGVRGVAILLVMLHHLNVTPDDVSDDPWFKFLTSVGWIGVDLFFTLSGFLITGILLDAKGERAGPYFGNFYARRTLRIFPLYYALLVVALVILPRLPFDKARALGETSVSPWWYWLYASNIRFATLTEFPNPVLGMTWSLAVEEHFYLVWPLLVFLQRPRALARTCVALIVTAFALRCGLLLAGRNPIAVYVLTFCRMDSLAIGALLAVVLRDPGWRAAFAAWPRRLLLPLLLASLTVIFWGTPGWGRNRVQTVGYTLFALTGAMLIARALQWSAGQPVKRVLTSRLVVAFGKYSYALYMIHMPLRAAFRDMVMPYANFPRLFGSALPGHVIFYLVTGGLSFGAAFLSYHLYEKHFLKLKRLFPTKTAARSSKPDAKPAPAGEAVPLGSPLPALPGAGGESDRAVAPVRSGV